MSVIKSNLCKNLMPLILLYIMTAFPYGLSEKLIKGFPAAFSV